MRLLLEKKESCREAVRGLLLNGMGWSVIEAEPLSAFVARLTFAAPHYHPIPLYMDEPKMILRTEDLVKKYKARTVVNHVSINVQQGEIVGLLGPNGAGPRSPTTPSTNAPASASATWRRRPPSFAR